MARSYTVLHGNPCIVYAVDPWTFPRVVWKDHPIGILATTKSLTVDVDAVVAWRNQFLKHRVHFLVPANSLLSSQVVDCVSVYAGVDDLETLVSACRQIYGAVGIGHDPAFDLFHFWPKNLELRQDPRLLFSGGGPKNKELLKIAEQEPRIRKCGAVRFWEAALP